MIKRDFLERVGQAAIVTPFLPITANTQTKSEPKRYTINGDYEFWKHIREDHALKPDVYHRC